MLDLLIGIGEWLKDHPQIAFVYLPMLLWGHTWQRAGRINGKWSPLLLGFVVVVVAYWLWPGFRRFAHALGLFGWLVVARKVGWPGRMIWASITNAGVFCWVWRLYGWKAIWAGAPLNLRTLAEARRLRLAWRAGKLGVADSHAHGALVSRPRMGANGVIRSLIRPAPGKSLVDLVELAARGSVGASVNYHGRHLGASQLHRTLIRPTGGPEGEGELISLPDDPLKQEFASPRVVR